MILTRCNLLRRGIIEGTIDLTNRHLETMNIVSSCRLSIDSFKECHSDEPQPACYSNYEELLKENRDQIRETKAKYEDEHVNCEDLQKMTMLDQMILEFKKILERFDNLLKNFAKIQEYERI